MHPIVIVLILILMEHAQRVSHSVNQRKRTEKSLNPYFNGTCSKRYESYREYILTYDSLNPYFNGTCSKSVAEVHEIEKVACLNPYFNGTCSKRNGEIRSYFKGSQS